VPSKKSAAAEPQTQRPPDPRWSPLWATPSRYGSGDGDFVIDYAESLLHVAKGPAAGEPLTFTDWQAWLMRQLLERRVDGRLRYRRALIGLARKNGKSLLGSALALYHLTEATEQAEVYAAAGDRQQARIVFGEAKWQVQNAPELASQCKVYRDAIEYPTTGSVFRVLSADARLQQGLNPSLVIFDEVHVQPNHDLWDALTLGSGARVDPLVVGITTAGYDLDTLCGQLYGYGKGVADGTIDDPAFGFWWWEAPTDCAIDDAEAWGAANPNLADDLLDLEDMASSAKQTQELAFRRYRLNQWTNSQESWLPSGAWHACVGDTSFDPDLPVWLGVDMALKHDSIAVVSVQPQSDGTFRVRHKIWYPDGTTVDIAAVENYIRAEHRLWSLSEVAYDPAYFVRSAQALEDEGLPMVEFPQTGARMVPACQTAYELICGGRVVHDGTPSLSDQVTAAVPRETDQGWRLSKGKSKRKIDAAVALVMALSRATTRVEVETQAIAIVL
jgi:phage terminase large subunit-like protein